MTTGRKKGAKQVQDDRCKTIIDLHKSGMKASWIANILKMNHGTVYSIIRRKKLKNMRNHEGASRDCPSGRSVGYEGRSITTHLNILR